MALLLTSLAFSLSLHTHAKPEEDVSGLFFVPFPPFVFPSHTLPWLAQFSGIHETTSCSLANELSQSGRVRGEGARLLPVKVLILVAF